MKDEFRRGTIVDPPAGWQYGFPKPYLPNEGESFNDWLVREGYPKEMLHLADLSTRFWYDDEMPVKEAGK